VQPKRGGFGSLRLNRVPKKEETKGRLGWVRGKGNRKFGFTSYVGVCIMVVGTPGVGLKEEKGIGRPVQDTRCS